MCQHQPRCPRSRAPDHLVARIVAAHPEQGWRMLCNGVIVFDDGAELLPDGRTIPPGRPAVAGPLAMAASGRNDAHDVMGQSPASHRPAGNHNARSRPEGRIIRAFQRSSCHSPIEAPEIQAANEPMADLRDMYMAHTMMRREFRLFPQAVRDVAPGDNRSAAVVADHAQKVCLILGLHHEDEDAVLWPLLWERGAEQAAAIVPSMEEQHQGIEAALHNVHALVPAWQSTAQDGENLAASIDALLDRLLEHMAVEKKVILPLAEKFVTAAEWARLGERALSEKPKKDLPLASA